MCIERSSNATTQISCVCFGTWNGYFCISMTPRWKDVDASEVEYNEHNDPIL